MLVETVKFEYFSVIPYSIQKDAEMDSFEISCSDEKKYSTFLEGAKNFQEYLSANFTREEFRGIFGLNTEEFRGCKIVIPAYFNFFKFMTACEFGEDFQIHFKVHSEMFKDFSREWIKNDSLIEIVNKSLVLREKFKGQGLGLILTRNALQNIFSNDKFEIITLGGGQSEYLFGYSYWPELGFEKTPGQSMPDGFPHKFSQFTKADFSNWREEGEFLELYMDKFIYLNRAKQIIEDKIKNKFNN